MPFGEILTSPHVMTAAQLARRLELHTRALGVPGLVEIGRYRYASAYEGLRLQTHRGGIEICFLARGRQTYRVNRGIYRLRGGDQYVVFPGEPHDSAGLPEEKGVLYWLFVQLEPRRRPILFLDVRASAELKRALLALPARHFAAGAGTENLLEEIIAAAQKGRAPLDRLATAALVLRYLFATLRAAHRHQRLRPSPRIQRCLDHVETHVEEPLSVPELARFARLSESRFKKRFRREAGLPPKEFVLRCKIEAAARRLALPGARVTAVAHALGFSSSQYFATVFRRYLGRSPTRHRAESRAPRPAMKFPGK